MLKSNKSTSLSLDWIGQIPSSIAIIDTDYKFKSASPKWLANFQLDLKSIQGKDIIAIFPELKQELKTRLTYSLDGLRDIKFKYNAKVCQHPAKDAIWHLNPWKDGYGNIIGVIIKVEPISKTQELQLELSKAKLILNQKSAIAKIGSWEYDLINKQLHWTPVINKIYGVPADYKPTLSSAINFYLEGTSRTTIENVIEKAISLGKPWNEKLQLKRQDGTIIWVNTIGRPKYKEGKCIRIIGTIQNIKNTLEQNLNPLGVQSNTYPLFEKVPFGLAIIDYSTGKFVDVNQHFLNLTNFKKEFFTNKHYTEFLKSNLKDKSTAIVKQLNNNGAFNPIKFAFKTNTNHTLNLKVSGSFLEDTTGKNILCTIENITSQTSLEKNLKKTISLSKEKNDQLLNFAHMVSHNLKTHATNFSLLLNFLNAENGKSERSKLMTMLFSASDNLSETIKGLREIVEVKSSINEEKKVLSLNENIFLVEQNVAGLLKETKGKIINEIPDTVQIKALPAYLNSILTNCITNSIKYRRADKKPIIILSTEEDKNYTVLNIEDNGQGINLEKFGHKLFGLYNTFHRNKDSRGIGLYITKNQIEAMNGKIDAISTPGQGTTFKIYFNKN